MDKNFGAHIPEEMLEEFAMGMLPEEDCVAWEEHLLVCESCQDRLCEADEYILDLKSATTEFQKTRRLAKPMVAALHA